MLPTKLTARVIDESGKPVEGATVGIRVSNGWDFRDGFNDFEGKSDAEGMFTAECLGDGGESVIGVQKEGFYLSRKDYRFRLRTREEIRAAGRVLPWNPVVEVILKKTGRPIPMIVRTGGGGDCRRMGNAPAWDDRFF